MNTVTTFIIVFGSAGLILIILFVAFIVYRNSMREAKNYERGLKMVPILIHLPPASDDIDEYQHQGFYEPDLWTAPCVI